MYHRFTNRLFSKRTSPEKVFIITISIIASIAAIIFYFSTIDRVPASHEDYDELYNQLLLVENNPDEFLKHKSKIAVYDDYIIYTIENDECKMTATYSHDYHLIDYSQKDKSASLFFAIILSVGIGFVVLFIVHLIMFFVVFVGESLVIGIISLFKK